MNHPTCETAEELGLLKEEYDLILKKLGRRPNFTELAMFSAMWSEHCSYKNSILLLKELYAESELLLALPGTENAGALKLNEKYAVVFKIESHNHPSAIEPYQGAATGVGGIMRDIFTMGARPVASLNSLRFGGMEQPGNVFLSEEVVKGIGDYGNSLGIPCIGGEVFFHDSFTKNPLVNAMSIGIVEIEKMASSRASGGGNGGNLVVYAGAKTGRDGIHGASFASKDLSETAEEERSAVQVGDPFMEKILMEASLECIEKGLCVAIQDMGAAGLLSSSSEMSASGDVGMSLDLSRIPAREENMLPFEFLLSESQERMLLVVEKKNLNQVQKIYQKWELNALPIGKVTRKKSLKVFMGDQLFADIPPGLLTREAPRYRRKSRKPAPLVGRGREKKCGMSRELIQNKDIPGWEKLVTNFISSPNLASKAGIYEQYDTDIGAGRSLGPGQNAGVVSVHGTGLGIAASVDCRSDYVFIDPYLGAKHSVAESYRNVISTGAVPVGITNCLNFANPYKPENFYYFENAVKGMSDAAETLEIPITGGNVSFYNESESGPVLPTPTIGMVGVHRFPERALSILLEPQQKVYLWGMFQPEILSSHYQYLHQKEYYPPLPHLDLNIEKKIGFFFLELFEQNLLEAAIDISIGGLLAALLRMLFQSMNTQGSELGFHFHEQTLKTLLKNHGSYDDLLWGESAHSYLAAVHPRKENDFCVYASELSKENPVVRVFFLGEVTEKHEIHLHPDFIFSIERAYKEWSQRCFTANMDQKKNIP